MKRFIWLVIAVLVIAAIVFAVGARYRSSPAVSRSNSDMRTRVQVALEQRFAHQYLSYRWVACVPLGRFFDGEKEFRCNVSFGDPHIVPYCAVLIHSHLVTDHEDRNLPCSRRVKADEADLPPANP